MAGTEQRVEGQPASQETAGAVKPLPGSNIAAPGPSMLAASLAVLILAALFRTGWANVVLVLLCAVLLLLNPWVRTFLELPAVSEKGIRLSAYDPARFLPLDSTRGEGADEHDEPSERSKTVEDGAKRALHQSEAYAALRRMPASLRTPLADLEELVIRDYVSTWYDYHSFGEQCLPNQARYSIDHAVGSVYAAMETVQSVDVTSELLLTSSSVLLTTLRARRLYPGQKPIFSSDMARIAALREALDRVFIRHLKSADGKCDLLRILLREILCKQIWNAIGGIGEPDFINRKIVEWGEKQRAKEALEARAIVPDGTTALAPDGAERLSASALPRTAPSTQWNAASAASPSKRRDLASPTLEGNGFASVSTPTSSTPPRPAPLSTEPLTTQPRAMAMPSPSPLAKSAAADRAAGSSVPPSPKYAAPSLPKRPLSVDRSNSMEGLGDGSGLMQPPILPPRKDTRPQQSREEDSIWSVIPMNAPPEAHKGMVLPESLQRSIKASGADDPYDAEGYRISSEVGRSESRQSHPASLDLDRASSFDASPSKGGHSSVDSQAFPSRSRPGSRPGSRPVSSASGGIPPAPDLAEVLSSTGSPSLSALRDAFESFLERGGAASRSLFFSPPSAATVAPGEGEALLKLHVGLATIARLVPGEASEEGELYREDACSIAIKAVQSLDQADDSIAGRPLREALIVAVQRLDNANDGRVREVMRPVELSLWTRLQGLYDHFWKETCTRPAGSRPSVISPTLGNSGRASFSASRQSEDRPRPSMDQLNYQPRKKMSSSAAQSIPMAAPTPVIIPRPGSTPPSRFATRTDNGEERPKSWLANSGATEVTTPPPVPPRKEQMTRPVPRRAEVQPGSSDDEEGEGERSSLAQSAIIDEPEHLSPSIEITATDVSPNADRPTMTVDVRTYEVMIAVEGLVSGGGGFVLLRQWRDFQLLEEQLRRSTDGVDLPARLPSPKGKTSLTLTRQVEEYLVKLLSNPALVENESVQYFVDKTRAGEAASNRSSLLMDSLRLSKGGLGLGKSLANGVGVVGKNAFSTLQMMPGSVTAMRTGTRGQSIDGGGGSGNGVGLQDKVKTRQEEERHDEGLDVGREREAYHATPLGPLSAQATESEVTAPAELSQQDLDNLLSCFFAIADEAFNLSGGWTLRRGMLRVLEQVVRTQYWSSIMGMFHNLSHSLNQEQIGGWLTQLKDKFWPLDRKPAAKTAAEKTKTALDSHGEGETIQEAASALLDAAEETKERTSAEKSACHLKAKSIVVAQTPVGSAYFLGPGGKQSCEKALNLLHEEVCNPETSLDLVLTVVLKLCDIVAR